MHIYLLGDVTRLGLSWCEREREQARVCDKVYTLSLSLSLSLVCSLALIPLDVEQKIYILRSHTQTTAH